MLWLLVSSDRKWTLCVCQCLSVCFYGFSSRQVVQFYSLAVFAFFFHHIFSPGVLTGLLVCFGARRNKSCLFEEFEKARGLLMKQKHPEVCWKVKGILDVSFSTRYEVSVEKICNIRSRQCTWALFEKVSCFKLQKT